MAQVVCSDACKATAQAGHMHGPAGFRATKGRCRHVLEVRPCHAPGQGHAEGLDTQQRLTMPT